MHLILATTEDAEFINKVYNQAIPAGLATADINFQTTTQRIHWIEEHLQQSRPVWIIYDQDKAIGWASLSTFYNRPAYKNTVEVSLYLSKNEQDQGQGSAALKLLIKAAQEMGIQTLLAFIFAHNTPSLKLFKKNGFEPWAFLPEIAQMPQGLRSLEILGFKIKD